MLPTDLTKKPLFEIQINTENNSEKKVKSKNNKFSISGCYNKCVKMVSSAFTIEIKEKNPKIFQPFPAPFPTDIIYRIFTEANPQTYGRLSLTSVDMYNMSKSKILLTIFNKELISLCKDFAKNETEEITIDSFKNKAAELNQIFIGKFSDMEIKCALRKALLEEHGCHTFCDLSRAVLNAFPIEDVMGLYVFYTELAKNPEGMVRYNRMETILNIEIITPSYF